MKILLHSPAFHPQIGGLEAVVEMLAEELVCRGHEVTVLCQVPAAGGEPFSFPVIRRPSPGCFLHWVRWCDVFFQANVSLRGLWPLLLVRRPWIVSHHSWYRRPDGRIAWQDRWKRRLLRRAAASIAVSRAIAEDLDSPSLVIANPYRDDLFRPLPRVERRDELLFVGRLVSDKGVDVLVEALGLLAADGLRPQLTVVGDGPEAAELQELARYRGVEGQIHFRGRRTGEELVEILNRHRILVVPSRYREPFGIVALEGIACGCLVVGSAGGGLGEAIGPCGWTFGNGDPAALARLLARLLRDPDATVPPAEVRAQHLASHTRSAVTSRYLDVLESVVRPRRGSSSPIDVEREEPGDG